MSALEVVKEFWRIQDGGDYTAVVELFADNAVLEDPYYGRFEGKPAIAGFMQKMNEVMGEQKTHFTLVEAAGDNTVAWAQWIAHTAAGDFHGCGLYRAENGKMTYYRDYMMREETEYSHS